VPYDSFLIRYRSTAHPHLPSSPFIVLAYGKAPHVRVRSVGCKWSQSDIAPSWNYIFRKREEGRKGEATQGGRGVLWQKRGANTFPLDPFALILSVLFLGVLENFKLF